MNVKIYIPIEKKSFFVWVFYLATTPLVLFVVFIVGL